MTRLNWQTSGTRFYEAGVDRGVLYVASLTGVPWTGLISVDENPTGGESKAYYQDGVMYQNVATAEQYGATITAYTYPDEFAQCDGTYSIRDGLYLTGQFRKDFGLSYRTLVGNDLSGLDHGYKIHMIYNAKVNPSRMNRASLTDSIEPTNFSWNVTARPPVMAGYRRTAHVIIDSRTTNPITLASLEDILYGSDTTSARLPSFTELLTTFDTLFDLEVTDNGDGTYTIAGPDEAITTIATHKYQIDWPTVEATVDEHVYNISS